MNSSHNPYLLSLKQASGLGGQRSAKSNCFSRKKNRKRSWREDKPNYCCYRRVSQSAQTLRDAWWNSWCHSCHSIFYLWLSSLSVLSERFIFCEIPPLHLWKSNLYQMVTIIRTRAVWVMELPQIWILSASRSVRCKLCLPPGKLGLSCVRLRVS